MKAVGELSTKQQCEGNFGQKHEAVSREKFEEEKKLLLRDAKGLFKMK